MVQCLSGMHEALGSILSIMKNIKYIQIHSLCVPVYVICTLSAWNFQLLTFLFDLGTFLERKVTRLALKDQITLGSITNNSHGLRSVAVSLYASVSSWLRCRLRLNLLILRTHIYGIPTLCYKVLPRCLEITSKQNPQTAVFMGQLILIEWKDHPYHN
jgi:hypothetical protein